MLHLVGAPFCDCFEIEGTSPDDPVFRRNFSDNVVGIGADFALSFDWSKENTGAKESTWYIASVPTTSTAFRAGLRPGDAVLQVM